MGLQDHNLRGTGVQAVQFFRVGQFHDVAVYQPLAALIPATGAKPDHLGKGGAEVAVELPADFPEFVVGLFGKTAGQVGHDYIGPVPQGLTHEFADAAAPPAVPAKGQASQQAQDAPGKIIAYGPLLFHGMQR